MYARIAGLTLALIGLAGCDNAKASLPTPVRGIWGNNCDTPVVSFTETGIHVYADNATYALDSVTFNGNDLTLKYTSHRGPVVETYMKSGETLRFDHGTVAGAAVTGSAHAMDRCG